MERWSASFGAGGVAFTGQVADTSRAEGANARSLSVLGDDSVVVGDFRYLAQYDQTSYVIALALTHINASGLPDPTFNPDGLPRSTATYLPILDRNAASFMSPPFSASFRDANGKHLVLTGVQLAGDLQTNVALLRFNADGSVDPTFNAAGPYPGMNRRYLSDGGSSGEQIAQDALGRYYVVGTAGAGSGFVAIVARFNGDGTNDASFNDGINPYVAVRFGTGPDSTCSEGTAIRVDAGGIWVGGKSRQCPTLAVPVPWAYGAVARLQFAGTLDPAFNPAGARPGTLLLPIEGTRGVNRITDFIDSADGSVLVTHSTTTRVFVAGQEDLFDVRVLRMSPTGVVDATYGAGAGFVQCVSCGAGLVADIAGAAKAPDGRIYVGSIGRLQAIPGAAGPPVILRLDPSGDRDTSFGTNGELSMASVVANTYVAQRALKFDSLGRLVVQGQTQFGNSPNAEFRLRVARYTVDVDTQPNPFSFASVTGVARSSVQTSASVVVSGIDAPAPVTVTGGTYSVGCTATYTAAAGSITNGQTICLRHTASPLYSSSVTTTLTIGGSMEPSPPRRSTTRCRIRSRSRTSRSSALEHPDLERGDHRRHYGGHACVGIRRNLLDWMHGTFRLSPGTITNFQTVCLRHTASPLYSLSVTTTLTIGGISGTFTSTTLDDTVPNPFSLPSLTGVRRRASRRRQRSRSTA